MKNADTKTLSTVYTETHTGRTTQQTLRILDFIHRFRHVTAYHVQLSLGHTSINTTNHRLALLCAKGYILKHYDTTQRAAIYCLTPAGLDVLEIRYPDQTYRRVQTVKTDATMNPSTCKRHLALADTYAYFKRYYNGTFNFSSVFDIAQLACMPDETPDGYVRINLPDIGRRHYFIEIYGWGRSTAVQRRRLQGYLQFAESERWQTMTGELEPALFIIAGSERARRLLHAQLKQDLQACFADNLHIYTTLAAKLQAGTSAIWQEATP